MTNTIPLDEALAAALAARKADASATPQMRVGDLIRTGQALVTLRNPDGLHLVYRLRARQPWTGRDGRERPGGGYWLDCRVAGVEWVAVGIADPAGGLRYTENATPDRAIRYGARILLRALVDNVRVISTDAGRVYTLHVEDRCGRCGEELTDPLSVEDGLGPTCYEREHGHRRPTFKQRQASADTIP